MLCSTYADTFTVTSWSSEEMFDFKALRITQSHSHTKHSDSLWRKCCVNQELFDNWVHTLNTQILFDKCGKIKLWRSGSHSKHSDSLWFSHSLWQMPSTSGSLFRRQHNCCIQIQRNEAACLQVCLCQTGCLNNTGGGSSPDTNIATPEHDCSRAF